MVLASASPATAADEPLFSNEPDAITTICGGRCRPTVYVGRRYEVPRASASFDSFSNGRLGAKGKALARGPRPRAFDAVEGTPLDPLLNTTYDLNSPKNVPQLRGQ
jgi:UPF0755 protein